MLISLCQAMMGRVLVGERLGAVGVAGLMGAPGRGQSGNGAGSRWIFGTKGTSWKGVQRAGGRLGAVGVAGLRVAPGGGGAEAGRGGGGRLGAVGSFPVCPCTKLPINPDIYRGIQGGGGVHQLTAPCLTLARQLQDMLYIVTASF